MRKGNFREGGREGGKETDSVSQWGRTESLKGREGLLNEVGGGSEREEGGGWGRDKGGEAETEKETGKGER